MLLANAVADDADADQADKNVMDNLIEQLRTGAWRDRRRKFSRAEPFTKSVRRQLPSIEDAPEQSAGDSGAGTSFK